MVRITMVGMVGSLLMVATGCALESNPVNYESTLSRATRGVVLHDAANNPGLAQAGMSSTTCDVNTDFGSVSTDRDYPGSNDSVDDVAEDSNGDVQVIVTGDKTVHVQEAGGFMGTSSRDYDVEGVLVARNFGDGAMVLSEGDGNDCNIVTVGTHNDDTIRLDPAIQCAGVHTLETDPTAGGAWVGSDAGLFDVSGPEVVTIREEASNIVAYDPYTDALYTAELGDSVVRAIESDGSLRWEVDVGGAVYSLDDVGAEESVAVSINYDDSTGTGAVVFIDGWTGEVRGDQLTNGQNNRVVTSRDGTQLAVVNDAGVDFYAVNPGLVSDGWDVNWGDVGSDIGSDIDWDMQ